MTGQPFPHALDLAEFAFAEPTPLDWHPVWEEEVAAAWREPRFGPPAPTGWCAMRDRVSRLLATCLGVRLDAVHFRLYSQQLD